MSLSHLIYTSIADPVLRYNDYQTLVNRASRFNASTNITGLLVLSRLRFVQILEGDPAHLKPLFQRIQRDPRHHKVELVEFCSIDERRFSEWRMRLVYLEELDCFQQWSHVFDHSQRSPKETYPPEDYVCMLKSVRHELMNQPAANPSTAAPSNV
jgi:hypothetical protein